jgi:hypothetical protein
MGLLVSLSSCGLLQPMATSKFESPNIQTNPISETLTKESLPVQETADAIPTFNPLTGPSSTPGSDQLQDLIYGSITAKDNGKTIIFHVTSRFWVYLDDSKYPLRDLLKSIPDGLIGFVSNGSIRGPQCYPFMFDAI